MAGPTTNTGPNSNQNITQNGVFTHDLNPSLTALAIGGDAFVNNAIQDFTNTVSASGTSTGDIIAAAAKLKMQLGASKAYYDVISTLGDDQKRLIEGAVK